MALPDQELIALLTDLESDRVERKESAANSDRLSEAICAFANDMPGYGEPGVLFVGVSDRGAVLNRPVTDELLRHLADLRDQGTILPPPMMTVRKLRVDRGEVAVVEVQPSAAPPVRFKGRVSIRVGPRRAIASLDEERRLNERRRSLDLPFDSRPIPGAALTDLDDYAFTSVLLPALLPHDVLEENERSTGQRLAALRLTSQDGVPTAAGVLAVGVDPMAFVPGAYVQFLRLDGDGLDASIKDEKRLDGTLLDVLRQLDEVLELNITTSVDFTSGRREERMPDYPLVALQQVARNAVLHRSYEHTASPIRITWYSDRVEVISPGGPYGIVSVDNFGRPGVTDYRNPALADLLRGLGYVQRFGMGLPSTRRSLERNSNPPPEFTVTDSHVAVTMRRRL
ncbi:MAG: ATP-binding protein [Pseudonocardiaceae bacterium]